MRQILPKTSSLPDNRQWYGSFLLSFAFVIIADRLSKAWIEANFSLNESKHLFGPLSLTRVSNTGGVWGIDAPQAALMILSFLAIVIVIASLFYFRKTDSRGLPAAISLGLLLAGSIGNLIDRIFSEGVTDFIDIHLWGGLDWATFNIADIGIVVGAVLLGYSLWRQWQKPSDDDSECNPNEDSM